VVSGATAVTLAAAAVAGTLSSGSKRRTEEMAKAQEQQ
jgi:hypothetical protein